MAKKKEVDISNIIWLYALYLGIFIGVPFFTLHSIINLEVAKNPTEPCNWWWALLLIYAAALSVMAYYFHRAKLAIHLFWSILLGLFLYTIHWIIDGFYLPTAFCAWYTPTEIVLFLSYLFAFNYYRKTSPKRSKVKKTNSTKSGQKRIAL